MEHNVKIADGQLWGGRFTGKPDERFAKFNESFSFDRRLFGADVRGCIAHCAGLHAAGVLTDDEARQITDGLHLILEESRADASYFELPGIEDVHSFIERRLINRIGDAGRKLHTGRSRNDQVATALRLYLRDETDATLDDLREVQAALLRAAERHAEAVLPGYTHLQRAQPVLWTHWCLAYFEMFERDRARLRDCRQRTNVMPLGSAALAGTSYPIDRLAVARDLGFDDVTRNSLDGVSDRDFAIEYAFAAALAMAHLSRLAEDIIIYASAEFGFVELSDAVATGSSLMPQKKNPDAMELVRGKAGRVFGNTLALLTLIKGLPLAYNKDMQEDKEALFDTIDTVRASLQVTRIVLDNMRVQEDRAHAAASAGGMNATELADYLVRRGLPFRTAHEAVGRLVLLAVERGVELNDLPLAEMRRVAPEVGEDVYEALSLEATINSKDVIGGTNPARVAQALVEARTRLEV